jgi:hypothetical protein
MGIEILFRGREVGNGVVENRASSRDLRKMTNQGVIDL